MPLPMLATPSSLFRNCSSEGVEMNPNSMRQLGIDVSRSTRNPACFTPLLGRAATAHVRFCTSRASSTLCAMFLSCINSNMI